LKKAEPPVKARNDFVIDSEEYREGKHETGQLRYRRRIKKKKREI